MANVIKLRKGLDINLKGKAQDKELSVAFGDEYALVPDDFAAFYNRFFYCRLPGMAFYGSVYSLFDVLYWRLFGFYLGWI